MRRQLLLELSQPLKTENNNINHFPLPVPQPVTMRSPYNAVYDTMNELGLLQTFHETITQDPENPQRWLITIESCAATPTPHRRLDIEVIEGDPNPYACVLNRFAIGYRPMSRIMNKLMDRLEEARPSRPSGQSPPGGEPEVSWEE